MQVTVLKRGVQCLELRNWRAWRHSDGRVASGGTDTLLGNGMRQVFVSSRGH